MDKYVYIKLVNSDCVIIRLYIDNMLICSTSLNIIYKTNCLLFSKFYMKYMGAINIIFVLKSLHQ